MTASKATITIRPGAVVLVCSKGSATLTVPHSAKSLLANFREIDKAVADLAFLAKPQRTDLVLEMSPAEIAPVETDYVKSIGKRTGASQVFLQPSPNTLVALPTAPDPVESVGWTLFHRKGKTSKTPALLTMASGTVTLRCGGQSGTVPVLSTMPPRLLVADFASLADAVVRLKKRLDLPHGAIVALDASCNELTPMEQHCIAEAVFCAQMKPAWDWMAPPTEPADNQSTWWGFGVALAGIGGIFLGVPFGYPVAGSLALFFTVIGVRSWRDAQSKRNALASLLKPLAH